MSKLTQDKDETISKQRLEIDQLHSSLNENSCSLSSLNEKVGYSQICYGVSGNAM